MALWVVRAGSYGQGETFALENGIVGVGWEEIGDLQNVNSREQVKELMRSNYRDEKPMRISMWTGQVWAIRQKIQDNDIIALPLKSRAAIALGKATGRYKFRSDAPTVLQHSRPVKWLKEIPRNEFEDDILYSFGSLLAVFQVQRNDAEARVNALLEGKPRPESAKYEDEDEPIESGVPADLEEYSRDEIVRFIGQKYREHGLAELIAGLLLAQGYKVKVSPPGPDRGVDILAGRGVLGFEPPRLCVQVKSGSSQVDVKIVRELQGVIQNFGAEHGLIVSWGGYTGAADKEARNSFFQIRLWDATDVVASIQEHYESLPDELQAELPLKRIWTLHREEA